MDTSDIIITDERPEIPLDDILNALNVGSVSGLCIKNRDIAQFFMVYLRIANALRHNTSMRTLSIAGCSFRGQHRVLRYFFDNLNRQSSVRNLTLYGNTFDDKIEGIRCISNFLKVNTTIETLNLNFINFDIPPTEFGDLLSVLGSNPTIQNLVLQHNNLGNCPENIRRLSEKIKSSSSIRMLDLSFNCIGDHFENMDHLLNVFSCRSIQKLNLGFNDICGKNGFEFQPGPGLSVISTGMLINTSIYCLQLNCNMIGYQRGELDHLTKILDVTSTLRELHLSRNCIGTHTDELIRFLEILGTNTTIQALHLDRNCLGRCPNVLKSLSKLIKTNTKIQVLDLSNNNMMSLSENPLKNPLLKSMEMNFTIQRLILWDNKFDPLVFDRISKITERNRHNALSKRQFVRDVVTNCQFNLS